MGSSLASSIQAPSPGEEEQHAGPVVNGQMQKNKMTRRVFLGKSATIAGAAAATQHARTAAAEPTSKPDILLIMPDQMRGDCLSILGHAAVHTPQLDELAKQGVLFRRAYTTVASCIPARYGLLTGLYPQTSGVVGFKTKPFSTQPFPELLAAIGYTTVLAGRNMHQVPESGACGYQKQILGSTYVDKDDYDTFLRQAAPDTGGIRKLVEDLGVTYNFWQAETWPLAHELHPTEWAVDQARQATQGADAEKPLFLTASFYAPHPPLFPPRRYFERYMQHDDLPAPAHGAWVDWQDLCREGDQTRHRVLLDGDRLRRAQAGYFGLIEHMDNQIASLIREFKARSENAGRAWIVVFTSDHGEMLGDHGYFRKCEPYEGSANIPFIVSGSPSLGFKSGLRIKQPVCLEDIMPTLLRLAGANLPTHVDGVSLIPTLRGDQQRIRDWLHFEHAPCYSEAQAYHALTDGRLKYIWRPADGREQLFDLNEDPQEEHDLSKDTSYQAALEQWRVCLIQRLAGRPEGFSENGRLVPGRPYPPLNEGIPGAG
jgi:arylsulfatase